MFAAEVSYLGRQRPAIGLMRSGLVVARFGLFLQVLA